jgi:hypothetical protein
MNTTTHHGPEGLAEFAKACANDLFCTVQHEFKFPAGTSLQQWPAQEIKKENDKLLRSLRNSGNVYAIFVREPSKGSSWTKVYVGERKSSGLRERITQHLIDKHEKTGSMLEAVKTAVSNGADIGLSFIKVEPESLRLYVEETIIAKHKKELPWNTHG